MPTRRYDPKGRNGLKAYSKWEQHIILYSTDAYRSLHERNGFKKIHMQTNGLNLDTIFKETGVTASGDVLASTQECIDEKLYGDLLREFWRRTWVRHE